MGAACSCASRPSPAATRLPPGDDNQHRGLPAHTPLHRHLRNVKDYYRNSIRSGFVSFRDEDDSDVLDRIFRQSPLDAKWVLTKVGF